MCTDIYSLDIEYVDICRLYDILIENILTSNRSTSFIS